VQVLHLYKIAAQMGQEDNLHMALTRTVIASIGPTTTEALERHHLKPDLEPPHPKLGSLIRKAAESSTLLLRTKNHKDTSSS
jgi:uroporphyrinogen-III synthase